MSYQARWLFVLVVLAIPTVAAPPAPRDGASVRHTDNTKDLRTAAPAFASGPCPGTGDCCAANGTPGCEDSDCCQLVCAQDALLL